jgi:hypothetical protein
MNEQIHKEQRKAKAEDKKEVKRKQQKQKRREQIIKFQGQPREDLKRFTGLYGDPSGENQNRKLFVTVSCDGYLVSGAMWGDVAPWWMRSEDDKVFSYSDTFNKIRMEFETDAGGNTLRMRHTLEHMKNPLKRLGPLPDDWEPCMERPKR